MSIHWVDLTIIVVYMIAITGIGILSSRKEAKTSSGYFLAGRSLGWPVIGLALFATNISTVHLVGLASSGFSHGLVFGNYEWMATFFLMLLGLVFAPFYFRNRISTLPEYLERRYSAAARTLLAVMAVAGALFIHIGVSLYAGSKILEHFFQIPIYASIVLVAGLTVLYTVVGGLKAVVVTEAIQTFLLLLGAAAITVFGVIALREQGIDSYAILQEKVKPRQLSMIHPDGDYAWYAMLLGYPVLAIWYWCADQTIVQRVLGARTQRDAQIGPLFAGYIKILPVFLMVFPGIMAYVLFADKIQNPDQALPVLIDELIPVGLKGLIAAGLLAALMSTVAGALNSTATLVSIDIVKRFAGETNDRTLILVGRITAGVVMVLATLWSTQGEHFGGIFKGVNQMIGCLAPPISTVFIFGAFWARGTQQAALVTLIGGFALGAVVFVVDFPAFGYELISNKEHGWGIPFMMQAWWLFCICSVIYFFVSLMTPRPRSDQIEDLCWKNPLAAIASQKLTGFTDPRVIAAVLVAVMVALYVTFR